MGKVDLKKFFILSKVLESTKILSLTLLDTHFGFLLLITDYEMCIASQQEILTFHISNKSLKKQTTNTRTREIQASKQNNRNKSPQSRSDKNLK